MRFDILGPLRVTDHGVEHPVTAGRDRTVLAMLLLHPGRVVALDGLTDAVWEQAPPVTARGQLQTCVSRLRRTLPGASIVTDPAGYRLDVGSGDLDAAVFTRLVDEALRLSAQTPDEARLLFREALALWQGPALAGTASPSVRHAAAVLDERWAAAIEDWADLELAGGSGRELIPELAGLVERFPLRERLRAQLMLALYRAGRQADALAEYRRGRSMLLDELGVEPGVALRDMQQRILTGRAEAVTRLPADVERTGPAAYPHIAPLLPAAPGRPTHDVGSAPHRNRPASAHHRIGRIKDALQIQVRSGEALHGVLRYGGLCRAAPTAVSAAVALRRRLDDFSVPRLLADQG